MEDRQKCTDVLAAGQTIVITWSERMYGLQETGLTFEDSGVLYANFQNVKISLNGLLSNDNIERIEVVKDESKDKFIIGVSKVVIAIQSSDGSTSESAVYMPTDVAESISIGAHNWRDKWQATFADVELYQAEEEEFCQRLSDANKPKGDD